MSISHDMKENIESAAVYACGAFAKLSHLTLDDATKIVILIMFTARAAYDIIRLFRKIKEKDASNGNAD